MGACFSASKVSGSNSNNTNAAAAASHNRRGSTANPQPTTPDTKQDASVNQNQKKPNENPKKNSQQLKIKEKNVSRRTSGVIPCGKRTDFGYHKNFDERYTIGKLLGHGQFGYTYVAIDKENGDRVAVKKIEKNKMILPIAVEDVKREVKILQELTGHENVVQFHNAFEDDSYVYIVMELCEGGELLDRILSKKDSRYTEKDAAVVVRQMLKVAAECHLHGLVHRDMKPENFLFKSAKEDSPLKATDFGLSDFIKPGKKFHDIVGSAYYVAPEVLKRKSGPESDVWSIGVITYILLCGRRPFWDKTEDGIFKEVLRNKPDFRRKPWPSISPSAKDFIKKLLVKDPLARLTAAQALSHLWVREGGDASEIPIDISVLSNMRQFVKYSRLKQFALRALASTIGEEELADLRDQFDAIDVDKNGSISLEEMRQHTGLKGSIDPLLEEADIDKDGKISLSEFRRLLRTASISSRPHI
ncbi:Calcium-dependent protein kinase 16, partial [Cucurbita argyrosperma subsp. sororia]